MLVLSLAVAVALSLKRLEAAQCGPAREIPAPALHEIAVASADQYGFVIFYEPDLIARIGPVLSTFFLKHEYAHVCLGHVRHETFTIDPYNRSWLSDAYELQADCLAAKTLQLGSANWNLIPSGGQQTHVAELSFSGGYLDADIF